MAERIPQDADKFLVRLPDGMRDRIRLAAERNNRSMNSEIVNALERAFPVLDSGFNEEHQKAAEALEALTQILKKYGAL